jgi:hypothetical protein
MDGAGVGRVLDVVFVCLRRGNAVLFGTQGHWKRMPELKERMFECASGA